MAIDLEPAQGRRGSMKRGNTDGRRDRQLGVITQNRQRFEAYKAEDMYDAVKNQVCPFCGEGPFQVVARHVYLMHGIRSRELRDMIGALAQESICDPTFAKAVAARSVIANNSELRAKSLAARRTGTHGGYKMTKAARARMSEQRKGKRRSEGEQLKRTPRRYAQWVSFVCVCGVVGRRTEERMALYASGALRGPYCSKACAARNSPTPPPRHTGPRIRPRRPMPSVPHSSQHKGVGWDASRRKWRAFVRLNGRTVTIGRFDTEDDAARARAAWMPT